MIFSKNFPLVFTPLYAVGHSKLASCIDCNHLVNPTRRLDKRPAFKTWSTSDNRQFPSSKIIRCTCIVIQPYTTWATPAKNVLVFSLRTNYTRYPCPVWNLLICGLLTGPISVTSQLQVLTTYQISQLETGNLQSYWITIKSWVHSYTSLACES